LTEHLEELMPIVYTPTVGRACQDFSHIMRRPHGVWITPDDIGRIPSILQASGLPDVRLIVATDNERILGLGDQGAGGIGIPIGKLALYTAGAGLHPSFTLPVSLDVGTDNPVLLEDPLYLGYRKPRLRGERYDELIEAFVHAVHDVFPHALLQWEDFKQHNAIRVLERYRDRITSFNDDIQGTAAVVLGGILAALRRLGEPLSRQRIVLVGAGAAGLGIAHLVRMAMQADGASKEEVRRAVVLIDSHGLVFEGRIPLDEDKRPFALERAAMHRYGFRGQPEYDLETVIGAVRPTFLIGTTGAPGAFTESAIRLMAAGTRVPVVFPLSNPTSRAEATPEHVLTWSEGRALVATGSPFPPVRWRGEDRLIGQANNVFVFPGVGLGAIVGKARRITDSMMLAAARVLAASVSDERLALGALYPSPTELRAVSRAIAVQVVLQAHREGVAGEDVDSLVEAAVDRAMWFPAYDGGARAAGGTKDPPTPGRPDLTTPAHPVGVW
jgi:malic enzyme